MYRVSFLWMGKELKFAAMPFVITALVAVMMMEIRRWILSGVQKRYRHAENLLSAATRRQA